MIPQHNLINEWLQRESKCCWLGTGVNDKNGVEIYEGDKVVFGELDKTGTVNFRNAMFVIDHDNSDNFTVLGNTAGFVKIEVVGHVTEEDES